jgi:L-ascorbate metabolism protein UlaG (beta-lactamase superfamily)
MNRAARASATLTGTSQVRRREAGMTDVHPLAPGHGGTTVRFLGHSTFSLDLGAATVLTDPVLRSRVLFLRRTAARPAPPPRPPTVVLVSHLHHDHLDLPSLAGWALQSVLLVPRGSERLFRRHGFSHAVPLGPGEAHRVGELTVTATPARHSGRREPFGPTAEAVGYVLEARGHRVYFAGDTDLFASMRGLGAPLDLALLPVWGWGPRLGAGHLDPVRAAEAVARLRPRVAIPMHWGSLGVIGHWQRPARRRAPARAFAAEVRRRGLPTDVRVLAPGTGLTLVD